MKRFYQDFTKRILVTSLISFFSIFGFSATYYVSNSGSDSNSGTSATTPWATLVKVNSVSFLPGDIVLFKMGDTFSGQLLPKTGAIAYGSYGTGANPIISGFQTLSGWTNRGGGIYSASTTASNTLNLVTLDGTIQRKGRYPNNDFLRFESHTGLTTISDNQLTESPNWTGSEVVIKTSRYSLENKIVLTHTGGTLTFASVGHELQDGYGYFFQNSLQTLDSYGEWFVSNGTFYMYFGSVDPNSKTIRVSIVDDLIKIQNKTDITLNGLSLHGANSSLVYSNINCTNLKIVNCELKYSGNYGINSTPTGLVVDGCSISEVTNFGIYSYSANALIKNNIIQNIGIWEGMGQYLGYIGLAANGENSITEFNQIRNVGYNGIILRGNNSIVRYNHIDTFCTLLDDGGGIYTSNNTYTGRIIDHNICINGIGNFEGATNYSNTLPSTTLYAHGIYLDERAANITVSNNVTAYNSESGIFLHSAKDIDVTGNTSFNNAKYQLLFSHNTLADNMVDINVINNLFIAREGAEKCFYFTSNYNDLNFGSASGNVYARPVDDTKTFSIDTYNTSATTYDLAGWKTLSGYDVNSAKSSLVVSNSSEIILEYNASTTSKTVSIASPMIDVKGTKYSNSLTLQPFSSVVLIKDATAVFAPGAPTSVVATAGNATATVSFVAPASNGGSAITGYTVTSIPAGGTDIHAGSTSLNHTITGLTNGTSYTFTVKATNSVGSSVASSVSNSVIPTAPAATAYTFTGPTSGNVNTASSSFTVTPNNLYSGTITITPTGPGSAGISAKVLTFSNSSAAQTFTINPTVAGSITLTGTNSGTLTNSSSLTYTATAILPGAPTSVVATAGNATATVSFVAPASNGGSAITGYTVTSIPAGGTDIHAGSTSLNHTITGLTNGTSYTFTVKATNSVGSSVASSVSNSVIPTAPAATAYTFTGPTSGNVNTASSSFTVTPNNLYSGTITITPTGPGSAGISAKVLTFSNSSAAQTFTINPTVAGSITLTGTNSGTLTNSSSLTYTATAILPGAPTSVVATAGNATATVSFVAPASNGGSAITGYTVTSIPAGGTDIHAGSTSLNHTITGLTNGTSYTFMVKATNSVGTSVASSVSNSVIPTAPKDITSPVVSAFIIPSTSISQTVSISTFTASDNIGVTGYLLTETASIPSSDAAGWLSSVPSTYVFSSTGVKTLYAWTKDAEGNVSAPQYQTISISNISNNDPTPELNSHFTTAWEGENGLNHMNIVVVSADLENIPLAENDEIAVFSGSICVGTKKLSGAINRSVNSTYITISASQNDGSNNGFTEGDTIIFKIWDNKNGIEYLASSAIYKSDIPTWQTSGKYVPSGTAVVEISSYTSFTQVIELKKGYNMISTYVAAQNPQIVEVTKPLSDTGLLIKVQDEAGNSYENWGSFGGWVNQVGSIQVTEGYKIKVANNCALSITGRPIALPLDIPLKSGWNIISFPHTTELNAMTIIQPLIDQNKLVKVQDEEGNSIENWGIFGGWKNSIGNFIPGKAYKVKMSGDAVLTLQQSYPKSAVAMTAKLETEYFSGSYEGNGTDHMNINLVGLNKSEISVGDEIAAFDGEVCVGAIKITSDHLVSGSASLVVSALSADTEQDGFKAGNEIQLYSWNQITGNESKVETEIVNGFMKYEKNASVITKIKSGTTSSNTMMDLVKIDMYPNPSQGKFTVRFSQLVEDGSRIDILDISGRQIATRLITGTSEVFNLEHLPAGLYVVKSTLGTKVDTQKMIIN